jgi:hypothetical protein
MLEDEFLNIMGFLFKLMHNANLVIMGTAYTHYGSTGLVPGVEVSKPVRSLSWYSSF